MIAKGILAALLGAAGAWAQTAPAAPRVLAFAQGDDARTMQEMFNILRAMAVAPQVSLDAAGKRLSVTGTPAQTDLARWIFGLLDSPSAGADSRVYPVPESSDDVVRIFYPRVADLRQLQELVNAVRTVAEIQRITAFSPQKSLVIRGRNWQSDFAEWLIGQLDSPPAGPSTVSYSITGGEPRTYANGVQFGGAVRIFYLPERTTPAQLEATVTRVRKEAQIMRIVGYSAARAVVLRGSEQEAEAAAQALAGAR